MLTVAVTPAGSGVIEILPLKDYYENGEIVNIIAIPNTGRTFYKWHGDLNSYDSSISIIINSDKEIVADIPFFVFDNDF